jgi:hypothetical protein
MSVEVRVEAVIGDGPHARPGCHTVLALRWLMSDPLAVELTLTARPEHPALARGRWFVLRDALYDSLTAATGNGPVTLRPDAALDRVWFVFDRPGRPEHPVCVSIDRGVVAAFLEQTERFVAYGDEASGPAVDALLAEVLKA